RSTRPRPASPAPRHGAAARLPCRSRLTRPWLLGRLVTRRPTAGGVDRTHGLHDRLDPYDALILVPRSRHDHDTMARRQHHVERIVEGRLPRDHVEPAVTAHVVEPTGCLQIAQR